MKFQRTEQETTLMRKRQKGVSEYADDEVSETSSCSSRLSVESIAHEIDQPLVTVDHVECWGCKYKFGKPVIPGKEPAKDALWKCFVENKDLPVETLSQLMQTVFEREIYEPLLLARDEQIIPWVASTITTHVLCHMVDADMVINQEIRELGEMNKMLTQRFQTKHGDIDYQAVAASLNIRKQRISLINNKFKL